MGDYVRCLFLGFECPTGPTRPTPPARCTIGLWLGMGRSLLLTAFVRCLKYPQIRGTYQERQRSGLLVCRCKS
jgi:hypothetical protein